LFHLTGRDQDFSKKKAHPKKSRFARTGEDSAAYHHVRGDEPSCIRGNTVMKPSVCAVAAVFLSMACPSLVAADSNLGRARMDIKNIGKALEVYKAKHGAFPPDLLTLTQPDDNEAALLKDEALFDPWKRPYHYERDRLDPNTREPQVWSAGADPTDPSGKIANWPAPPPRSPSWEDVFKSIPGYVVLLISVVLLVLFCVAFKFWDDGKIGGWVVLLLVLLAVGWVVALEHLTFTRMDD
jgi:hypothetical protein